MAGSPSPGQQPGLCSSFLRVPVGESDLSLVPQFPHLKIKGKRAIGKVVIRINCCL